MNANPVKLRETRRAGDAGDDIWCRNGLPDPASAPIRRAVSANSLSPQIGMYDQNQSGHGKYEYEPEDCDASATADLDNIGV
jgi:hypothetical protein